MTPPPDDPRAAFRWHIYALLIAVSAGSMLGRILAVNSVDKAGVESYLVSKELGLRKQQLAAEGVPADQIDQRVKDMEAEVRAKLRQQRPFLSGNDRSRWTTVRSLVEHGTYVIDDIVAEPGWDTIDMVRHKDRNGEYHLYSSKPPLLATLLAGEYWVIHRLTGATLGTHPYEIGRCMLITVNVLPLIVCFLVLAKFAERLGQTDWGRVLTVAGACLGTFLTTFAVVINNHLPAAVGAAISLYAAYRIWYDGEQRWRYFIVAGLFAAFTAANELPALSFFTFLTAGLLWKAPRQTLLAYVPAALVVAAGFFGTNKIAHDRWAPPYAHRSYSDPGDNWYDYEYVRKSDGRVIQSYWRSPAGIDRGEPSPAKYALHMLIGHHGVFSLTPLWLLTIPGLFFLAGPVYRRRELSLFIAGISLICLVFYLSRPEIDRNYSGMSSGFRWMFWFAPLWLVGLIPAADRLASARWKRGLCIALLVLSVLSASYPTWNPWTHPWIMNLYLYLDWAKV